MKKRGCGLLLVLFLGACLGTTAQGEAAYRVAFVRYENGNSRKVILTMNSDGSNQDVLVSLDVETSELSPNADYVAFVDLHGNLRVLDINTGAVSLLAAQERAGYLVWSPDSQRLLFLTRAMWGATDYSDDLFVIERDGTNRRLLVEGTRILGLPNWSPDGSTIIFSAQSNDGGASRYAISPDGTHLRVWFSEEGGCMYCDSPRFTPDGGKIVFMIYPDLYLADVACINYTDGCERVARKFTEFNVEYTAVEPYHSRWGSAPAYSAAPDSSFLVYTFGLNRHKGGVDIGRVSLDQNSWETRQVLYHSTEQLVGGGLISPDSATIFFGVQSAGAADPTLYRMDSDGGNVKVLAVGWPLAIVSP